MQRYNKILPKLVSISKKMQKNDFFIAKRI